MKLPVTATSTLDTLHQSTPSKVTMADTQCTGEIGYGPHQDLVDINGILGASEVGTATDPFAALFARASASASLEDATSTETPMHFAFMDTNQDDNDDDVDPDNEDEDDDDVHGDGESSDSDSFFSCWWEDPDKLDERRQRANFSWNIHWSSLLR